MISFDHDFYQPDNFPLLGLFIDREELGTERLKANFAGAAAGDAGKAYAFLAVLSFAAQNNATCAKDPVFATAARKSLRNIFRALKDLGVNGQAEAADHVAHFYARGIAGPKDENFAAIWRRRSEALRPHAVENGEIAPALGRAAKIIPFRPRNP